MLQVRDIAFHYPKSTYGLQVARFASEAGRAPSMHESVCITLLSSPFPLVQLILPALATILWRSRWPISQVGKVGLGDPEKLVGATASRSPDGGRHHLLRPA